MREPFTMWPLAAMIERLENPLANVYGGAILGEKTFIKGALNKLKDGILQREEISNRKRLQAAFYFLYADDLHLFASG